MCPTLIVWCGLGFLIWYHIILTSWTRFKVRLGQDLVHIIHRLYFRNCRWATGNSIMFIMTNARQNMRHIGNHFSSSSNSYHSSNLQEQRIQQREGREWYLIDISLCHYCQLWLSKRMINCIYLNKTISNRSNIMI